MACGRIVMAPCYHQPAAAIQRGRSLTIAQAGFPQPTKLKALRAQIKTGVDALDRGDFVEVDDAKLDGFLEGLTARRINTLADPAWRAFASRCWRELTLRKSLL
jgi:predicted transcriptional regulator